MDRTTGDDDFDPSFDEDFSDENFDEGQVSEGDGDDAASGGDGPGGEHPAQSADDAELDGQAEGEARVSRPNRAQARVETALREAREAREQAARLEEQLRAIQTQGSRESDARAEEARIAQMEPWERAEYFARRAEERTNQTVQGLRQEMAEHTDRAAFAAECAANPRLAKIKDEVERRLVEARKGGVTLPRRTLAAYIIGEKVLTEAPKARAAAERKAAGNLSRERARPTGGGSDAPASRTRDEKSARMARLESASI